MKALRVPAVLLLAGVMAAGVLLFLWYSGERQAQDKDVNNLREIALGMKGYSQYEGHGNMIPQAIWDRDGKPLLSWRVALLPYIEQANLYKKFTLDEPWDGPHNKALLEDMPRQYESPRKNNKPGETFYQVFTGPDTAFPDPSKGTPPYALGRPAVRRGGGR